MAVCELMSSCLFFNDKMANMPGSAAAFKRSYCETDNERCARFTVYKAFGRAKVPPDLFPNQEKRAKRIIAAG